MPSSSLGRMRRPAYEPGARPRSRRRSRLWLVGLPMFAVFAAFGSIVWVAYVDSAPGSAVGEPPLIKADASPIKLSPDDPGGRVVADQGEVRQLLSDEATPQRERLLPPPEQPMAPLDETETAELAEIPDEPPAGTADQAQEDQQQAAEDQQQAAEADGEAASPGASASGREPVVATTTPETIPSAQVASGVDATTEAPSNGDAVDAAADASPAAQDAESALEALLAEVTGERNDQPSNETQPDRSSVAPAAGSASTAQDQGASPGASAGADRAARDDGGSTSPGATQGRASEGGRETSAAGRVPVEPMRSQTQLASSGPSYRIQLAAVRNESDARRAWDLFQLDLGDVLADLDPVIERAETANGTFYRVQVGEFASMSNAEALCDRLKQRNASCFVIRR